MRINLLAALLLAVALPAQQAPPSPKEFLGFEPGTDRRLADYDEVLAYFRALAAASDRVDIKILGDTTEGNPFAMAIISSPENLRRIDEIRLDNLALTDPRKTSAEQAKSIIARGKTIVLLNASIHSVEVGPTQSTMPIAWKLATTTDPEWLKVLDDVVFLMTPCHNPDGYNTQVRWYRRWVGTPHEGCPLPGLYHRYVGHDNNRDWFMFTQVETRLTVEKIHARWRPQIVLDMHQMGEDGPRMFVPPYQAPIEPNVDPLLIAMLNDLGNSIRADLLARDCKGIVSNTMFDAWTPARAYMHYHGGVRILTEIASCKQATPLERRGIGRNAHLKTETNPAPWTGDRWTLADIVRYNSEAAFAALRHASRNRERWLSNFHEIFGRACAPTSGPVAFVVPADQPSRAAFGKLIDIFDLGGLERLRTTRPLTIRGAAVPTGSVVIRADQPFFSFARALLENTPYPEVRDKPDGPIRRPYDVTANCLPLLMNLSVIVARRPIPDEVVEPIKAWTINKRVDSSDLKLERRPSFDVVLDSRAPLPRSFNKDSIAIYKPSLPNCMDEGWTRFFFDHFNIPFRSIDDGEMRRMSVATSRPNESRPSDAAVRVLVLPDLSADSILNGGRSELTPPEFRGGIGDEGAAWIESFVKNGGTLVALKDSTAFPIRLFKLPLRNALSDPNESGRVTIPGSILALDLDTKHPLAARCAERLPAFFEDGKAFELDPAPDRDQTFKPVFVGKWASEKSLLLGGYGEGLHRVAERGALVEVQVGSGRVILFGFSPQFRFQTWSTFPLFLNALQPLR